MNRLALPACWGLVLAAFAPAQTIPKLNAIRPHIRDDYDPSRLIGGQDDIVGIFAGSPEQSADFDGLAANLPVHAEHLLCGKFTSRDSAYKGEFAYDISTAKPGLYLVEFPSKWISKLHGFRADEFGVSLWLAAACEAPTTPQSVRVVASWSRAANKADLRVLINSRRLIGRIYDSSAEGELRYSACRDVKPPATSFDKICQYAWREGVTRVLDLQLFQFEEMQEQVEFRLSAP